MVIEGVGMQTKTTFLGGRSRTRFIDEHRIKEIIINEALTRFEVIFYLAIVVENSDEMVVIFPVSFY